MIAETPYYVIHKNELDDSLLKLKAALDTYWKNYVIGYSYKTNSLPWIVDYYHQNGCFAEVVSEHEYNLGRAVGVEESHFIYNGPIKTKESFIQALQAGCYVNIDSTREIEWLEALPCDRPYRLGIRVNFDIEKDCPGQSSGGDDGGRFGFCEENGEFEKALLQIANKGHQVCGLHLHISSKTRSLDIYRASARKACEIAEKYHMTLRYVDIGGGFFGGLANKPQFEDYIGCIAAELANVFSPETTTLIVEPGMALIGSPVSYVTSVIDVKDTTYGRFVVTDGSRTQIDPLFHKSNYFNHIDVGVRRSVLPKQVISGYTCMESDRIFVAENREELQVGDRIVYEKVGAYTMCLTPLFIKYFPAVYVQDDETCTLVRREWTARDYMQGSIIGEKEL